MKKTLAIVAALLLCLFALPALAEGDATVTAVGTATVTVVPDMANFTVGVSTQEVTVAAAQTANAAAMNKVIDSLKALNIAADDLQTENYSISPVSDYQSGENGDEQMLKGYMGSNTVVVTVRDLTALPTLLDAAVAAGANQSYGVNFTSSNSAAAFDEALTAAAQDALRKAKLMAQAIGRDTGDVVYLEEANDVYMAYTNSKSMAYDSAAGTPIEAGTLTVTANVRAEVAIK